MSQDDFDLDAYCARIGYGGPRAPTLAVLCALHEAHPQAIPFEALDPLHGTANKLDIGSLQAKLVGRKRGGYCFEHNLLFRAALRAMGFEAHGLGARVLWFTPEAVNAPGGHMALHVIAEGRDYLCDVGFGNLTQTAPVLIEAERAQATPHEDFRVMPMGHDWRLEARVRDAWRPIYRVSLHPQEDLDYEMQNFYLSTHPNSHFRSQLLAARPCEDGRWALANTQLAFHAKAGGTTKHTIDSAAELRDVLREKLLTEPPSDMEGIWARVAG